MSRSEWKNRIVGGGEKPAKDFIANPHNWRAHSAAQKSVLSAILGEVGWVQNVIVNKTTGNLIDGHARVEEALAASPDALVPFVEVELSETEEKKILAVFDPISAMATTETDLLAALNANIEFESSLLGSLVANLLAAENADLAALQNNEAAGDAAPRQSLVERFGVPPFSILDARQGYWQERKKAWVALGLQSEVGRGNDGDPTTRGLTFGTSAQPIRLYKEKEAATLIHGEMSWETFLRDHAAGMEVQHGTSVFDPVLCELVYRWFATGAARVLDPFAGGSVRGIVAAQLGLDYTGIELRPEQISANRLQAETICQSDKQPRWIAGDSRDLEALLNDDECFDLIFSCPPYFDLEIYSSDAADLSNFKTYAEFLAAYRTIIGKAVAKLRDNRFACFVVGDLRDEAGFYRNFVADTIAAFEAAGARLYNEAILITPLGSLPVRVSKQFLNSRKLGKTHQNVLIFFKGDPQTIKTFPPPQFGEVETNDDVDGA